MNEKHVFVNSAGRIVHIDVRRGKTHNLNARYNRLAGLSRKESESFGRGTVTDNRAVVGYSAGSPYFFMYLKDEEK